jgi:hypothetical protein
MNGQNKTPVGLMTAIGAMVMILTTGAVQAQPIVKVTLLAPPPFTLRLENLTSLRIDNTGRDPIEVVAEGTVTDARTGLLVARARTARFTLQPGTNIFTSANAPEFEETHIASGFKYIATTGIFGEGFYKVCIVIRYADAEEELGFDCREYQVRMPQLRLISPGDGAKITEPYPIFQWATIQPIQELEYTLKVVEILPGQTLADASNNIAHFEEKGLAGTLFRYPIGAKDFEAGKSYAWQITAFINDYPIATSPIGEFTAAGIGKIVGYKFDDRNGNGVWEGYRSTPWIPGDEPGLSGWTITLTGPESQTATTDANGRFEFTVRTPGTYTVAEKAGAGWQATTPSSVTISLQLFAGETVPEILFGNRELPKTPPPDWPPTICGARAFKSLIFTRAVDGQENEEQPELAQGEQEVEKCESIAAAPADNPEQWSSRDWILVSAEDSESQTTYRLVVSAPEATAVRLDNPIPALFGGLSPQSKCKPCNKRCDPVDPPMNSGTIPGRYLTRIEPCEGESVSAPGGEFYVSKLDAHGINPGTTDKFPDYAEVLPKRAGYVDSPVIQMNSGGDGSVHGCSLYGTVCNPVANKWEFTAVAKDPTTNENIPKGYTLEWSGIPYDIVKTENGQPLTIQCSLPAGRYFPTLKVYGPDPLTGKGNGLVGKAEIHSIVVEERPTCNVGVKNPDVAPDTLKGTAFHVTNHIGHSKLSVDMRIGIEGTVHPHLYFDIRGRVSLDGYPQNEYWLTAKDSSDLPQVATVPGDEPQTYYLQGYQIASTAKNDLRLKLEGQAQKEVCSSDLFFFDCTPCEALPSGYPVIVEWQETDIEPFNSSYPIVFTVDEPDLKYEESTPDPIEVEADNVADDYQANGEDEGYFVNNGHKGRVNFFASADWDFDGIDSHYFDHVEGDQALKIDWHFAALGNDEYGGPNHCDKPKLRDLEAPGGGQEDDDGKLTVLLTALTSRVQLNFTKEREGQLAAKSGDRFCLVPHSQFASSELGKAFWPKHNVALRPGDKVFHVVFPNQPTEQESPYIDSFNPRAMFDLPKQEFENRYGEWKWIAPTGSGGSDNLKLYAFDLYRNPLPAERPVIWSLEGGGRLMAYNSPNPGSEDTPPEELLDVTEANGLIRVRFTQDRYPTCPWQVEHHPNPSVIYLSVDGVSQTATYSVVTTSEELPRPLPPLRLCLEYIGNPVLDIAHQDQAVIRAQVTRGVRPVADVPVAFTSTNGKLSGGNNGVVRTGDDGYAAVTLTAKDARLTDEGFGAVLVTAGVADLRTSVGTHPNANGTSGLACAVGQSGTSDPSGPTVAQNPFPRWIDTSPVTLQVEHNVLVSDAFGDQFIDVETLDDRGELNAPEVQGLGGVPGNGLLRVPLYQESGVVLRGPPNHRFRVEISQPLALPPPGGRARYPFDVITNGLTPDAAGSNDAIVAGNVIVNQEHQEGSGSVQFIDGVVRVPNSLAVDATGGLQISFWIKPAQLRSAVLLLREGQYRLEALTNGRLKLTTQLGSTAVGEVTSDVSLVIGRWSYVEVRMAEGFAKLALGPNPDQLNAVFTTYPPGIFNLVTTPVEVGRGFAGLMDDLDFRKGGFNPEGLNTIGLNQDRTIVTDVNGRAEFIVRAVQITPQDYQPVTYRITVYGSEEAEATIFVIPQKIWGGLVSVGRAFSLGEESLGEDANWFQRAAAWVGENVPILSDLRTLTFEIYKAATGCDQVSWLNVTFATVGLLADIATFGAGSAALHGAQTLLNAVFKTILRETARNLVMDQAFKGAIEAFVRLATNEMVKTGSLSLTAAHPWVEASRQYLGDLRNWMNNEQQRGIVNEAFRSSHDLFIGLKVYQTYGRSEMERSFEATNEIEELADNAGLFLSLKVDRREDFYEAGKRVAMAKGIGGLGLASSAFSVPELIGAGPNNLIEADEHTVAALEIGTLARPPTPSPIRLAKNRLPAKAQRVRETLAITSKGIPGVGPEHPEAFAGLQRLTRLIAKGAKGSETPKMLASRARRALELVPDPAQRRQFLQHFDELYLYAYRTDRNLLKKLQGVARLFASRAKNLEARKRHAKGAALQIQEAFNAKQMGRLRGADAIEPPAPNGSKRLFRDLLETWPGGKKRYVELKSVNDLSSSVGKLGTQMHKHFLRHPKTPLSKLFPVEIRHTGPPLSAKDQNKVRSRVVAALIEHHEISTTQAQKWVKENIIFNTVELNYQIH